MILGQSSINRLWNVADNAVVGFFVDVEWNVVSLVEWHVCSIRQIEGHIIFLLASIVIIFVRPCLPKILQRSFLICSV